jgi:hypothetical protein
MTAYSYEEKKRLFAKRLRELRHAIKRGFSEEKLRAAAERLRAARLGMFKCQFTLKITSEPYNFSAEAMAKRHKGIRRWLSMSADEIVKSYETLAEKNRHEISQREGAAQKPD